MLPVWPILLQYSLAVHLLHLGFDSCLPLEILALTIMILLSECGHYVSIINGLVTLDLSNIGQYLDMTSFNGMVSLLYIIISTRSFFVN